MKKMTTQSVALGLVLLAAPLWAAATAQDVLSQIHATNLHEIHMGELAVAQGTSADVKAFGQALVDDHQKADEKVKDLAQKQGITLQPLGAIKKAMSKHEMDSLKDKKGADFDTTFAKDMVDGHQKTIADLTKAQADLGSTPTGALISDLLPTLQKHLQTAQGLATAKAS